MSSNSLAPVFRNLFSGQRTGPLPGWSWDPPADAPQPASYVLRGSWFGGPGQADEIFLPAESAQQYAGFWQAREPLGFGRHWVRVAVWTGLEPVWAEDTFEVVPAPGMPRFVSPYDGRMVEDPRPVWEIEPGPGGPVAEMHVYLDQDGPIHVFPGSGRVLFRPSEPLGPGQHGCSARAFGPGGQSFDWTRDLVIVGTANLPALPAIPVLVSGLAGHSTASPRPVWHWQAGTGGGPVVDWEIEGTLRPLIPWAPMTYTPEVDLPDGPVVFRVRGKNAAGAGPWLEDGGIVTTVNVATPEWIEPYRGRSIAERRPRWRWRPGAGGGPLGGYLLTTAVGGQLVLGAGVTEWEPAVDLPNGPFVVVLEAFNETWRSEGISDTVVVAIAPPPPPIWLDPFAGRIVRDPRPIWRWRAGDGGPTGRIAVSPEWLGGFEYREVFEYQPPEPLPPGVYTLRLWAETRGLASEFVEDSVRIETRDAPGPPVFEVFYGGATVANRFPLWRWHAGAGGPVDSWELAPSWLGVALPWHATEYQPDVHLPSGSHVFFRVRAMGPGGTSAWAEDEVRIDDRLPAIPEWLDPFGGAFTEDLTPTWRWRAGTDGGPTVVFTVWPSWSSSEPFETTFTEFTPAEPLPEGTYTLVVRAKNVAGLSAGAAKDAVVVRSAVEPPGSPIFTQFYAGQTVARPRPPWRWRPGPGPVPDRYEVRTSWMAEPFERTASEFQPASPLADGACWVEVRAKRGATTSTPARDQVVIARPATGRPVPPIWVKFFDGGVAGNPRPLWTWRAGEGGPPLTGYQVRASFLARPVTVTETQYRPVRPPAIGRHSIEVRALAAGGASEPIRDEVVVRDLRPPDVP